MAAINTYATTAEFKTYMTARGHDLATDTMDDSIIEDILEATSRDIDKITDDKTFYPRVETRVYNRPRDRQLDLDDDLLEVITLTNGDDTEISSSDYLLIDANASPKYAIRLKRASSVFWLSDSNANSEQVIDVLAFWGFHEDFAQRAWSVGSTLNESAELSAADTTLTVTSGTLFKVDQLIKIENEIIRITSISTNDLKVVRGENGSTAVTHDDGTTIYIWNTQPDIQDACLIIATGKKNRRYGENVSSVATITAAGVVITPQGLPAAAREILKRYSPWA
jgi:hypothetical protein